MQKKLAAVAVSASNGPPTLPQAEPGPEEYVFGVCDNVCRIYILVIVMLIVMFWGFYVGTHGGQTCQLCSNGVPPPGL